ncbi:MAG: hypothetical protein U0746_21720 [Gemmataceae bacterium]
MMTKIRLATLALIVLTAAGCSKGGPTKYPVRGIVLVNGVPTGMVVVQFSNTDPAVTGNARCPTALTKADGTFTMLTTKQDDGVPPGEYIVTFMHLDRPDPIPNDLLRGAYSDPAKSTFRVKVEDKAIDLPPYELTVDAKGKKN